MEEKKFNLILSDSITAMKLLIEKGTKVDMILCDLPYGTTSCSWDAVIPFAPLWDCYRQLIKDNGAIVLFGSQPFTTDLINSNREWFKYEIIWEKERPTNPLMANKQILKYHENILVFYEKCGVFNPQLMKRDVKNKRNNKRREYKSEHLGIQEGKYNDLNQSGANDFVKPQSVLYYPMERGLHPSQKPIELLKWLIVTYTNQNELVLDNTMGSGSVGAACMETQRRFIGIEKEQECFTIAEKRISAVANQIKLF